MRSSGFWPLFCHDRSSSWLMDPPTLPCYTPSAWSVMVAFRDRWMVLSVMAFGLGWFPCQVLAFTITAPAEKSVLTSGQEVAVTVDLGTEIGVRRVQYYWYRHGAEPVTVQQASPSLVTTAST